MFSMKKKLRNVIFICSTVGSLATVVSCSNKNEEVTKIKKPKTPLISKKQDNKPIVTTHKTNNIKHTIKTPQVKSTAMSVLIPATSTTATTNVYKNQNHKTVLININTNNKHNIIKKPVNNIKHIIQTHTDEENKQKYNEWKTKGWIKEEKVWVNGGKQQTVNTLTHIDVQELSNKDFYIPKGIEKIGPTGYLSNTLSNSNNLSNIFYLDRSAMVSSGSVLHLPDTFIIPEGVKVISPLAFVFAQLPSNFKLPTTLDNESLKLFNKNNGFSNWFTDNSESISEWINAGWNNYKEFDDNKNNPILFPKRAEWNKVNSNGVPLVGAHLEAHTSIQEILNQSTKNSDGYIELHKKLPTYIKNQLKKDVDTKINDLKQTTRYLTEYKSKGIKPAIYFNKNVGDIIQNLVYKFSPEVPAKTIFEIVRRFFPIEEVYQDVQQFQGVDSFSYHGIKLTDFENASFANAQIKPMSFKNAYRHIWEIKFKIDNKIKIVLIDVSGKITDIWVDGKPTTPSTVEAARLKIDPNNKHKYEVYIPTTH